MCVKYRLINAQLITDLISWLFVAMNAIQMYLIGGGQISKFLSIPLQVLWNVLRSCFQRNTQQISTLLHSMKDNWIHYIHDKNYKNSFSCNTLFGLTNVSITNFVHLQGLSHMFCFYWECSWCKGQIEKVISSFLTNVWERSLKVKERYHKLIW